MTQDRPKMTPLPASMNLTRVRANVVDKKIEDLQVSGK